MSDLEPEPRPEPAPAPENPYEPPRAVEPDRQPFRVGIGELMAVIAAIAIVMAAFVQAPGLGIAALVFMAPVALRTVVRAHRRRVDGRPMTGSEKLLTLVSSSVLVLVLALASAVCFGVTCFAGFWGGAIIGDAAGAGGPALEGLGWAFIGGGACGLLGLAAFVYFAGIRIWKNWSDVP